MHSSELEGSDNLYYWVLRAIEFLDDGEFLEGIMWFEEQASHILEGIDEWPENPILLDDCNEARDMIRNEDWPGVLESIEKLRTHMENMGYL